MLENKSIHQLRAIAQGYGINDIFAKTDVQLVQDIRLKQTQMIPARKEAVALPAYDARLMTKPPAKITKPDDLISMLQPYIDRGLQVTFPNQEEWHMVWGKSEDTGTMRQPLRNVVECAVRLMK